MGSDQSKARNNNTTENRLRNRVQSEQNAPARPPPPNIRNNTSTTNHSLNTFSGLERDRNPYSFNRDDLQQVLQTNTTPMQQLYPNLHFTETQNVQSSNPGNYSQQVNYSAQASSSRIDDVRASENINSYNRNTFTPSAPPPPPPVESRPSKPNNRNKNNDISCKTCKKSYSDKIYQCNQGHSSCEGCRLRRKPCGLCGQQITTMRNIDLEKCVFDIILLRCPNADDGCTLCFKVSEMEKHKKECPFKELKCPIRDCQWRGKLSQLSIHFDELHPSNREANVDTEMYVPNLSNNIFNVQLIKLGSYNFLLHLIVSQITRKVSMAVQLIGTKVSAAKWNYEVHVYNKREPRRKFQYIDRCQSFNDSIENLSNDKCAVMPLEYAMTYVNEGNLTYKLFIKKDNQYNGGDNNRGRGPRRNN